MKFGYKNLIGLFLSHSMINIGKLKTVAAIQNLYNPNNLCCILEYIVHNKQLFRLLQTLHCTVAIN